METAGFKFLDFESWRIVKTIRIEKQFGSRYIWADLIYTRSVSADYQWKSVKVQNSQGFFCDIKKEYPEDDFDKVVLKAVKQDYPDARFQNADVYTDWEADSYKRLYGKQFKETAIIYLQPYLDGYGSGPFPQENREFRIFRIPLDIYIPCEDFQPYFANEGYTLYYTYGKEEELKAFFKNKKPTFHRLEEIIRKQNY